VFVSIAVLSGLGLVAGLGLAAAARFFAVETDPRQEEIADLLPGANCGGCGFAGCNDFAAAVVKGAAEPGACPVSDEATLRTIAGIMGQALTAKAPMVALVACQGSEDAHLRKKYRYNGVATCASADLLGRGDRLCDYGCLGLGDCQRACGFAAIEITEMGVARVLAERCAGCGLCVEACPKGIVHLVPKAAEIHVLCSNHDKGGAAKKACAVACIGCKKCEKLVDGAGIAVDDFLAVVDYGHAPTDPALVEACPTGAIVRLTFTGADAEPGRPS